jgi:RNA polymerase sigma-70 factor (ECF subfamily)
VHSEEIQTKSDSEIVALCLTNIDFFAVLIDRYEAKLSHYIRRKAILSKEDAEDLLQNVFTKVYVNLPAYNKELSFSAWIYRIAHNETIDWYRKTKSRTHVYIDSEDEGLLETLSSSLNTEAEVSLHHDMEKLKQAIDKLDEKYKEPIILRFLEEKEYQEISDILRVPIGTVSTYVARGKKQLIQLLTQ